MKGSHKIRSPFAGFPEPKEINKNDNLRFIVKPSTLTPERAMVADFLGCASVIGSIYYCGLFVSYHPEPSGWAWIGAVIVPVLCTRIYQAIWRSLLKTESRFELDKEVFTQKRFPVSTTFDRELPHKFSLIQHDLAQEEKERHELAVRQAQAKGKVISKKRYYGESFHLSYEYLGQRNDLLTIFGRKEAIAIAARLKACDEVLNKHAGFDDGIPLSPEHQWNDQPGEIE